MLTTQFANYLSASTDIQQRAKPIGYLWTQEDHVFPSLASKTKSFWKSCIQLDLQSHYCRWGPFTIYFVQCQFYFYHIQLRFPIIIWPQLFFPAPLVYSAPKILYSLSPLDIHASKMILIFWSLHRSYACIAPSHVTRSVHVINRIGQRWWSLSFLIHFIVSVICSCILLGSNSLYC